MKNRNARFARARDLRDLRKPPYGLFLGYQGFPARPLLSDLPGHALVVAPTRAGKGVGLLMQNALCWPTSMIVLDPKGEFREKTLHWRAQYQDCFTWGPTTFAARWNPIAEIAAVEPENQMEQAMRLAKAFTPRPAQQKAATTASGPPRRRRFWPTPSCGPPHASMKLGPRLSRMSTIWSANPSTWRACTRISSDRRTPPWPPGRLRVRAKPNPSHPAFWPPRARICAALPPARCATPPPRPSSPTPGCSSPPRPCTCKHRRPTSPPHGPLLVAFLEGFISRALADTQTLAEPLLLLLDEFSLLPALPSLRTLLTLSAGFHLRLLIVLQNLSQVTPEVRDIVLSNTFDQVFFAARDLATSEHLTKRLGTIYRKSRSTSRSRTGTSRSESDRREDLMAPHQIRAMKKSLLFHGNAPPARITLRPYYQDKRFTTRLGDVLPPTPAPHTAPSLEALLPNRPHQRATTAHPRAPLRTSTTLTTSMHSSTTMTSHSDQYDWSGIEPVFWPLSQAGIRARVNSLRSPVPVPSRCSARCAHRNSRLRGGPGRAPPPKPRP